MGVNVEMLKTCVVCGSEKRISDPCLGLQLPLPVESMRLVRVIRDCNMFERTHTHDIRTQVPFIFVPWKSKNNTLMKYAVWVPKVGNCNDLRRSASELLKIPSQNIVLAEVVNRSNNIRKLYRGVDKIVFLSSSPLVLYEMPISVYRTTSPPTLQRMSSMESGISLIRVVVMSTRNFTFLIPIVSSKISSPRLYDLLSSKCDGEFTISIVSRNETNETKTILSRTWCSSVKRETFNYFNHFIFSCFNCYLSLKLREYHSLTHTA